MTHLARRRAAVLLALLATAAVAALGVRSGLAADPTPVVGSWATYQWTSSVTAEVPVLVRRTAPDGRETWTIERDRLAPPPVFVTYGIVDGNATRYVLQIVTTDTLEGPALAVTHVTVDRASGKALRSVTRRPQGVIATPESALRPFREAGVQGTAEEVAVPAGRFTAVRARHRDGTVWVSDRVPALGLVKAVYGNGQLELVRSGASGARDLLRS